MDLADAAAKDGFAGRFLLSERVLKCVEADALDKCNWLPSAPRSGTRLRRDPAQEDT